MSQQQIQADISDSSEEEFTENLTPAEATAIDTAWDDTLNSSESNSFLDKLIAEGIAELNSKK